MSVKRIESNIHIFLRALVFEVLHTGKEIVTLFKAWSRIRMQSIRLRKNVLFAKWSRREQAIKRIKLSRLTSKRYGN